MGCVGSKQRRCEHCKAPRAPGRRSYSMQAEHNAKSESVHLVALTSSTLGSLKLDLSTSTLSEDAHMDVGFAANGDLMKHCKGKKSGVIKDQFLGGLVEEAKTWSSMIEAKIPKTPIKTPDGEPEMIDVQELMKGLENISPFRSPSHLRSFSSDAAFLGPVQDNARSIVASFEKERVVLYFTSLRGVRKTYEDCCDVRSILKGSGVRVDERDVSMHLGFKEELKELLGGQPALLPEIFAGKRYIGGAEEIRRLHEEGQLEEKLEGCERMAGDGAGKECEACGNVRFVPCEKCWGSCKVYREEEEEEEDDKKGVHEESDQHGFQRCPDCNENGLVRCPMCCY
ncbi:hypothetical protein SAY87_018591 [Trapa incisa]|uniref:Glutaredoxin domain-containing protein n=1 Tax=Trapa incisa TaxID=236973 RepID=A0AAN7L5N1_9MYRT|nr:hypothetical protein SAY87_018591 [Trapa incisa]